MRVYSWTGYAKLDLSIAKYPKIMHKLESCSKNRMLYRYMASDKKKIFQSSEIKYAVGKKKILC